MEAEEVKVIVYEARNLCGGKKGRFKFSVIFGIGGKKFRTAVVHEPSGNPAFNEESTIDVDNYKHTLSLIVTDKDEIMGQVTIPVQSLPSSKARHQKKSTLQPHKKCQNPQGELIYDCYVVKYKDTNIVTTQTPRKSSTLQMLKDTIRQSPLIHRRSRTESNESENNNKVLPGNLLRRNSQSLQDISAKANNRHSGSGSFSNLMSNHHNANSNPFLAEDNEEIPVAPPSPRHMEGGITFSTETGIVTTDTKPEIFSVSPTESNCTGGTLVSIEGMSLGDSRDDIISLTICGVDCLSTLTFESSNNLSCLTMPSSCAAVGDVTLCLRTGDQCSAPTLFKFVGPVPNGTAKNMDTNDTNDSSVKKRLLTRIASYDNWREKKRDRKESTIQNEPDYLAPPSPKVSQSFFKSKPSRDELIQKVKKLEETNRDLEIKMKKMEEYIDGLVSKVIIQCPELLQS